jgi:chromosome segregation ATPase
MSKVPTQYPTQKAGKHSQRVRKSTLTEIIKNAQSDTVNSAFNAALVWRKVADAIGLLETEKQTAEDDLAHAEMVIDSQKSDIDQLQAQLAHSIHLLDEQAEELKEQEKELEEQKQVVDLLNPIGGLSWNSGEEELTDEQIKEALGEEVV